MDGFSLSTYRPEVQGQCYDASYTKNSYYPQADNKDQIAQDSEPKSLSLHFHHRNSDTEKKGSWSGPLRSLEKALRGVLSGYRLSPLVVNFSVAEACVQGCTWRILQGKNPFAIRVPICVGTGFAASIGPLGLKVTSNCQKRGPTCWAARTSTITV